MYIINTDTHEVFVVSSDFKGYGKTAKTGYTFNSTRVMAKEL